MTDLFLMGSFILCIVIGYLVVKKSGGMLEQMLFRNSKVWYDNANADPKPDRTWRTRLKQLAADRRKADQDCRESLRGWGERSGEEGAAFAESRRASELYSVQRKNRAGNSGLKAGIKHEWKTN